MGDREVVRELLQKLLRDGTGATRQLEAWRRNGNAGLRRLYAATIAAPTVLTSTRLGRASREPDEPRLASGLA
jgi:carboxylate-amine ligase